MDEDYPQDLRSNNLSLDEAITVAQNRPLWRLMSAFGATHPFGCLRHKKKKKKTSVLQHEMVYFKKLQVRRHTDYSINMTST